MNSGKVESWHGTIISPTWHVHVQNGQWYHTRLLKGWHCIIIIVAGESLHFFFDGATMKQRRGVRRCCDEVLPRRPMMPWSFAGAAALPWSAAL